MPPLILGAQHTTFDTGQVLTYTNLAPQSLGDPLPSTARVYGNSGSGNGTSYRSDDFKVARFRGSYYMLGSDGVYKLQNDNSWSKDTLDGGLTFTSPSDDSPYIDSVIKGGLFVATVNNKPRLFGWYKYDESIQVGHHRSFYLDPDTGNWVLGALTNVGSVVGAHTYRGYDPSWGGNGNWAGLYYQFFDGKQLHILGNTQSNRAFGLNSEHKVFNPSLDTWATVTNPTTGNTDGQWNRSFCIWQGRLFSIHYGSAANVNYRASLWELVNNVWTEVLQIAIPAYDNNRSSAGRNPLWTDGTNLYFMMRFQQFSADGWRCYQITPSLVASEITTAVIPSGLREAQPSTSGFLPIIDSVSSPGQTTIYLRYWDNHIYGTPMILYKWNGPTSKLSIVDMGGNVANALPHGVLSGTHLYSTGPEVVIEDILDTLTGKTLNFKVYGGGTGKTVRFYAGDILQTEAILSGTATGGSAVRNGNQIENVDADGTTVYTVDFNATANGLFDGDSPRLLGVTV